MIVLGKPVHPDTSLTTGVGVKIIFCRMPVSATSPVSGVTIPAIAPRTVGLRPPAC